MARPPLLTIAAAFAALSLSPAWLARAAPVDPTPPHRGMATISPTDGLPEVYLRDDDSDDDSDDGATDSDSGDGFVVIDAAMPMVGAADIEAVLLAAGDGLALIQPAAAAPIDDSHGPTIVPLPAALALFGSALCGLSILRRR